MKNLCRWLIPLRKPIIIADGHVDLPYRLHRKALQAYEKEYLGIPVSSPTEGDFDYVRAKKGGLDAPFMSIYIPTGSQQQPGVAKNLGRFID
jgi:membrane dipeptidase